MRQRQLGPPDRTRVAALVEGPQLGPLERARMAITVAGSQFGALERNDLGVWRATQQAGPWQRRGATWGEQGRGEPLGVSVGREAAPAGGSEVEAQAPPGGASPSP